MNTPPMFIELPSAPMQSIYSQILQLAASGIHFFITGETGVGKEGIARYIHKNGTRQDKPFIAVNCGRFTAELLQSELFGHEEGAYTGAIHQRQGAFEKANGGTLFLDEVVEMAMEAQTMLLRVLDTGTFTRLGGNEHLRADFDIISATNKNIGAAVLATGFRPDLYYRLMGVMLHIPMLRERQDDIAPLVEAFITEFNSEYGKSVTGISAEALAHLKQAAWPGNIRQLRVTVQTAVALATTATLEIKDFPYNFFVPLDGTMPDRQSAPRKDMSDTRDSIPTLISQVRALPAKTQNSIIQAISTHVPNLPKKEMYCTENMNLRQILYQIARTRIEKYPTLLEAAASLGIDTRTLKVYARPDEDEAGDPVKGFDFF